MGTGASKTASQGKTNKDNRQLKPVHTKLRAAAVLAKQSSVPGLSAYDTFVKSKGWITLWDTPANCIMFRRWLNSSTAKCWGRHISLNNSRELDSHIKRTGFLLGKKALRNSKILIVAWHFFHPPRGNNPKITHHLLSAFLGAQYPKNYHKSSLWKFRCWTPWGNKISSQTRRWTKTDVHYVLNERLLASFKFQVRSVVAFSSNREDLLALNDNLRWFNYLLFWYYLH